MKRMYVDTPEGQVHCRVEGSGEPLVMLHQVKVSSDQYSEVIPIVAKRYWTIGIDILGYGNSDNPPENYKVEDYGRNIIHVLSALNIQKTNVIGRLFGASIAVEIATAYPERVDKLILSNCCYAEPEFQKARYEFYRNKRMELKEDGSHLIEEWKGRLERTNLDLRMAQRALVDVLRSDLGIRAEDGHRALWSYYLGPKLPLIKSPTLLLYGAKDSQLGRLEATRSLIPRCLTKIIEGTGSYPEWEKPEEWAKAILDFLDNPRI